MTGVCSSGDAGGFGPPVPEEPTHLVVDLPVPDWLEHAFATGEWPEETDNAWSTLSLPEGRYDAAEPVADVEPGAWVAPGVPVDRTGDAEHPVVAAIAAASACLELDGLDWMGAADTGAGLVAARRLTARASALVALLVAQAEEVELHRQNGAATAAVWLANASAVTRRDAYRFARVLEALGSRCGTHLAPACEAGAVDVEQADVIVKALDALPEDLSAKLRVEAEEVLVGFAADHDARALRQLGKKLLTVIAPEVGEAHEAALLEREEREARAASRLTMTSDGHGRVHGRFTLPELYGVMLRKALDAYAAPRHLNQAEGPDHASERTGRRRSATGGRSSSCWTCSTTRTYRPRAGRVRPSWSR